MRNFWCPLVVSLAVGLVGCDERVSVLDGHSFQSGDWLFVKWNGMNNEYWVIDDEKILERHTQGVIVSWNDDHSGTTCDGAYRLYRNGELVSDQDFLDANHVLESTEIGDALRAAAQFTIDPNSSEHFDLLWDSLKATPGNYPTRYHAQPADKDVIWAYRYAP